MMQPQTGRTADEAARIRFHELVRVSGVKRKTRARRLDTLTPEERSERMSRVRGKDTQPELLVRRLVHGMGYRYRLHSRKLPGRPDMVFPARKRVIFVHGCFWHRHTNCSLARLPKSRLDFWRPKLEENKKRDVRTRDKLRRLGWRVLVVWECQLRDEKKLVRRVQRFMEGRR